MPARQFAEDLPGLVFTTDPKGLNTFSNARFQAYAGVDQDRLRGTRWLKIVHPDDRAIADLRGRSSDPASANGFHVECRLRRADGQYRRHRLSMLPQRDATGVISAWVCLAADIDNDIAARQRQRSRPPHGTKTAFLDALFSAAPIGIGFWDRNLRYVRVNPVLADMNGLSPEAHVGKTPNEILPEIRNLDEVLAQWREVINSGRPLLNVTVRGKTLSSTTERVWVEDFVPVWHQDEIIGLAALVQETTETEALRAEQTRLIDRLAADDRRKDQFLAVLSHELRNPLAPLKTGIDLLRLSGEDAALRERVQVMMTRQIEQIVALVDDLLDISRINRGTVTLNRAAVNLTTLISDAVETTLQALAGTRSISVEVPPEPLMIDGDRVRLIQILTSLLGNACKYTKENGNIQVRAERHQRHLIVSVQDDGAGIEPGLLEKIFDMYYQGQAGGDGGLGIGLTLVRAMVRLHGGEVLARSDGPGRGAEFVMTLPALANAENEAPRLMRAAKAWKVDALLVDDNVDAADALAMLMRLKGATVNVAHDSASALALLETRKPRMALLDINMSGMNGYQLAQAIRAQESGSSVCLIAVTGLGQEEDKERARTAGFDHHLTKPVDTDALAHIIHQLIR